MNLHVCLAYSHFYQQYQDSKTLKNFLHEISANRGIPLQCEVLKIVARLRNKVQRLPSSSKIGNLYQRNLHKNTTKTTSLIPLRECSDCHYFSYNTGNIDSNKLGKLCLLGQFGSEPNKVQSKLLMYMRPGTVWGNMSRLCLD